MLWAVGLLASLVAMALLVDKRYPSIWENLSRARIEQVASLVGIGVSLTIIIVLLAIGGAALEWTGFGGKTLWDWLQILSALAIPAVLTVAGFWFSSELDQRQRKTEALRAETEHRLEQQRAQDAALQAYLDQMSTLLLDEDLRKDLRNSGADSEVLTLAQARTATVIQRLDAEGNRNVIRFLTEARLTEGGKSSNSLLAGADLQGAHLERVDLSNIDLSDTVLEDAKLSGAKLSGATLRDANLRDADLKDANLLGAELSGANLGDAILRGATLEEADLDGVHLIQADLNGANLIRADLNGADLSEADLSKADLSEANLNDSAFFGANLSEANLFGAILSEVRLSGANLDDAILSGVPLEEADLDGILQSSFSGTSSGWPSHIYSEKQPYVVEYAAGRLRMYNPPPPNQIRTLNNRAVVAEIEDARVEVDATVSGNAPKNSGWGIICRAVDNANYYTLGIYADGRPRIWKLKDNQWIELRTAKKPNDAFRGGTAKNHLRADCLGNKLTLYINGRSVLQTEDSEFKSGQLGLYVEDSFNEESIDLSFDKFLVKGPRPVIIRDDFSDTSSGWPELKGGKKNPYVIEYTADDQFRMYDPPPLRSSSIYALNSTVTEIEDARVEVDATVSGNAPESQYTRWGIICRAVDNANYYTLGISADGRPTIWKLEDNQWIELRTAKKPNDAFRGGTAKNHLRADCLGNKLTLYINGQRVLQTEDSEFKSGQLGLLAVRDGETIDVSFDNFLVK